MDKIILLTSYYKSENEKRQKEIDDTLQRNLRNPLIKKIWLFLDDKFSPKEIDNKKIGIIDTGYCPTYQNYIDFINEHPDFENSFSMIANSDIFFDESLNLLKLIDMENTCILLNRWDLIENKEPEFLDLSGSQDVWIFKGRIKKN